VEIIDPFSQALGHHAYRILSINANMRTFMFHLIAAQRLYHPGQLVLILQVVRVHEGQFLLVLTFEFVEG
jgi:hypothetical protein